MTKLTLIVALVVWLSGCALQRRVNAYNQRVTDKCHAAHPEGRWTDATGLHYTCDPLSYPSCEAGLFGGQECK